ncbi:hypothetical protein GRI97_03235 [Altererythrobacter xixiisoli]|uniref:Peptidase inhibitor I78 family protein n=1 Tax=Croceibacterium xixiisoli TaxID=1476466 RepID=A0A6I4TS97_9SPHN|nr:I78 family peptidase inhibitor [Croceibacterium xixiisoli]MXO98001.1 hypothetical protein [Croceibacterium xixiisoli]
MRLMFQIACPAALLLAGCQTSTATDDVASAPAGAGTGLCREAVIGTLVGQTRINDGAASQFTGARTIRQIRPGDAVTEDFRADRATIETDPDTGRITRAFCG